MLLSLVNLIIYNFLQSRISYVAIFNCWDSQTKNAFLSKASIVGMYTQLIYAKNHSDDFEIIEQWVLAHRRSLLGVFLDMNCASSERILDVANRNRFFGDRYHWLIYDEMTDMQRFRDYFSTANLSVNADVTYAIPNRNELSSESDSFKLYDVYSNGNHLGGKLNMTIDRQIVCDRRLRGRNVCRLDRFLSDLHLRSKHGNRNNLRDVALRVTLVVTKIPHTSPEPIIHAYLASANNTALDAIARHGYQQLMVLKDTLNCRFAYNYDYFWGTTEISGGAIGELTNDSIEFVGTPFLITFRRLPYLRPITESTSFRSVCMFRTPRNSGLKGDVFLYPFSGPVWISFACVLLLAAIFLWSSFRTAPRHLPMQPSFLTLCLVAFGSACYQGTNVIPRSLGGRITFLSLSIVTYIMYNYYTSLVVSSLLGSPIKSNIKTLGQLADSPLDVALEALPYQMVYLNTSQTPAVRRFVQRKITSKRNPASVWLPAEEGILRVRDNRGFVYVFEASTGYELVEKFYRPHEICDLNEILLRPEKSLYFHMHKNSSYIEIVKRNNIRIMETGVFFKHYRYWTKNRPKCYANNQIINVGMEYAAPLLFMLAYAYGIVLCVLFCERTHYKRREIQSKWRQYLIRSD